MKITVFILILFCLAATSCETALEENFQVFTIAQGEHYATQRHVEALQQASLAFQARFDETAEYRLRDGFQDSKNKLLGFSDCNSAHHENSARFAWQWYNNRIEIFAYCYVDGQRMEAFLGTVEKNEVANYEVVISPTAYTFIFKDQKTEIARRSKCDVGVYVMLWPYFGGQIPAPHEINIYLRRF